MTTRVYPNVGRSNFMRNSGPASSHAPAAESAKSRPRTARRHRPTGASSHSSPGNRRAAPPMYSQGCDHQPAPSARLLAVNVP